MKLITPDDQHSMLSRRDVLADLGTVALAGVCLPVASLAIPANAPTNIAFGGPGLRTVFVTLAGSGTLIAIPWPRSGLALNQIPRAERNVL
jgi:hypothetical protein